MRTTRGHIHGREPNDPIPETCDRKRHRDDPTAPGLKTPIPGGVRCTLVGSDTQAERLRSLADYAHLLRGLAMDDPRRGP